MCMIDIIQYYRLDARATVSLPFTHSPMHISLHTRYYIILYYIIVKPLMMYAAAAVSIHISIFINIVR